MTGWHVEQEVFVRFVSDPRSIDAVTASSVETHLTACAQCRATTATIGEPAAVDASWHAIADVIDQPQRSIVERILAVVLPDSSARVVAATPALRAATLAAMVAVAVAASTAARSVATAEPFLAVAPLLPLGAVALAFGPAPDPAGEVALATPRHGAALVLMRALVVVGAAIVVLLGASLFGPGPSLASAAWLLPAMAVAACAMAMATWFSPYSAVLIAALGWMGAVFVYSVDWINQGGDGAMAVHRLFAAPAQVVFAGLLVAAVALTIGRRESLTVLEAR